MKTEPAVPDRTEASPGTVRKLVFVGFMGAGKSRAARRVAARLGQEAIDSDRLLAAELGESIESFFDNHGEAAFREREEALVLSLLDRPGPAVLALGGGAVESARVRERLAHHLSIYLAVDHELAWQRAHDSGRPLARDKARFGELLAIRTPLYEATARAVLPTEEGGAPEAALEAAVALQGPGVPSTVRLIWARTADGGYPVYVGKGALDAIGALWPGGARAFSVVDEHVDALHGARLVTALSPSVPQGATVGVPPGERYKTLQEAERVLTELARAGMQRSDALVALGGGVVGDLAGFCGAVYQRGVPVVHVPSSLVAQIDSAYGGKTGVDLPEAKNYVGSFHQPGAVFTDPALLSTLPLAELRAGFAEVVKTGLIAGGALWEDVLALDPIDEAFERNPERVEKLIEGCIRLKLDVVARDELDLGERAALNLGHTSAHALEAATGYTRYRHGEAVALGLLVATRLSEQVLGLEPSVREGVLDLLRQNALPTIFDGPSVDDLLRHASLDKKRRGAQRNLVLIGAPGRVAIESEVSEEALRDAIQEIRGDDAAPAAKKKDPRR